MKIKYLKIRNIASIENGDIDFENALIDNETGLPSALFLITGDTGSGKSAILDCISMALYGTTPRVKSVSDSRNNVYKNNDGEEISVNNIRQYTRIGISWKDECFTELSFTGNDGIDYISNFSLGRTSHRNYRDPSWKLTIDNAKIIDKRDEIKETIQKAVGLSFEQFSRMAMLAQGQFATFLTGKKEERERILEQLTATDIFSRYGEAITNIFKRTRDEKELCAKIYEKDRKDLLSGEERSRLIREQDEMKSRSSILQAEMDKLRQTVKHTEAAMKAEKEIADLKAEENSLKENENDPEFKKGETLIALWDETAAQRELLSDKIKLSNSIGSDIRAIQEMKSEFSELSADLSSRKDEAEKRTLSLEKERTWLETRQPLSKTFTDSSVTILQIDSFISLGKETVQKETFSQNGKVEIEMILKTEASQKTEAEEKRKKCEDCQLCINTKSAERNAIDSNKLIKEHDRLIARRYSLKDLSNRLVNMEGEKKDLDTADKELQAELVVLAQLKETAEKASKERLDAEKTMNEADDRFRTMHLSLDQNFKDLRRKLSEEHAANCPLCGQSIIEHLQDWSSEEYFSGILSPLEKEKERLTEVFARAKEDADEAVRKMNTTAGSVKSKEKELKKRTKSLAKSEDEICSLITALEISPTDSLKESVEKELVKTDSDINLLEEKISLANKIQSEIDILIRQKESLDKDYQEADRILQKTSRQLAKKKEEVRNAEDRITELKNETQHLQETIDEALKGYADDWMSDPKASAERLKKEAEEFYARSSCYDRDEIAHSAIMKTLDQLSDTHIALSAQLDKIEGSAEPALSSTLKSLKTETIRKKWNDFHIEVSTAFRRLADSEVKIKEIDRELNDYYFATQKTETTIRQLLGAEKEVKDAREVQQKHRDAVGKNATLMEEAIKNRDENLKALDIEESSRLEDLVTIQKSLLSYDEEYGRLSEQLGVIKQKLEADEETRRQSEVQRAELEQKTLRFEKWEKMNKYFGGTRFRTLVQSHILRPLLNNANIYLHQITDHYTLTCSDENEQLSILVLDRYHNNEPRSVTVLSGGERFMISLALSLALSAMNRPDLNVDILFIDEGFGTLDAKSLEMVMSTLRRLPEINGQTGRRVGVISHREELTEQIPTQIQLHRSGEGRSRIVISNS